MIPIEWGVVRRDDIQKLLGDVASYIVRELRDPFDESIHIM